MLSSIARCLVRQLDTLMRRVSGIREFSSDPNCLLRFRVTASNDQVDFGDGRIVRKGETIGELHLWSERVPIMPADGPDMRWAVAMRRDFEYSLRLLAHYVDQNPHLRTIVWFRGRGALSAPANQPSPFRILERLGLRVLQLAPDGAFWSGFVRFWKNLHNWCLVWTFNPSSLTGKRFGQLARVEFWISREELMTRYSPQARRAVGQGHAETSSSGMS
jgi:hypothetical protein